MPYNSICYLVIEMLSPGSENFQEKSNLKIKLTKIIISRLFHWITDMEYLTKLGAFF